MKKILLFAGVYTISIAAFAETPEPKVIEDAVIRAISPNGKYAVSESENGMRIFDLESGEEYTQTSEVGYEPYQPGQTKCVSNDGIVVGVSMLDGAPAYRKGGKWENLPLPESATYSNLAQAITSDGSRICGSIGVTGISFEDDVLMQAPCVWNAEEDGYGYPVMLPHPDFDFAGRVPQYITAIDLSEDGKVVIGQVRDATGSLHYPIIYREDEKGEWSFEIPYENLINPDKLDIVPYPTDCPTQPQYESYMTPDEIEAYIKACRECYDSNFELPYPQYPDFMTAEEIAEYNKAADEYNELAKAYNEKLDKYFAFMEGVTASTPGYVFNSIRISPDGKTFGCTIEVVGERDPISWGRPKVENSVWTFDLSSDNITKYEKDGDLNLYSIANNSIGLACTLSGVATNSFILQNGETTDMLSWMNSKVPEYAAWMKENMVYTYEDWVYNENTDNYEEVVAEETMTGQPASTPDLSVIALSVPNKWDYMTAGSAYIFDMNAGSGVNASRPVSEEQTIYDLSGLKLKNVSAPGIYIINGEKKIVR